MEVADGAFGAEEVPRFWFSRRWCIAVLACIGFLIVTSQRVCLDITLVCMLNTTSRDNPAPMTPLAYSYNLRFASVTKPLPGNERCDVASSRDLFRTSLQYARELGLYNYNDDVNVDVRTPCSLIKSMNGATNETSGHGVGVEERGVRRGGAGEGEGGGGVGEEVEFENDIQCTNISVIAVLNNTLFTIKKSGDIVWTVSQTTAVIDAFYWGDLFMRIPGGLLAQRYGGKWVFGFSMLFGSLCTVVIPLTSQVNYFLVILLRFFTGLSAGCTISSTSYLLGRWSPPDERCFLYAIANIGGWVSGSVVALPLTGVLTLYGFDGGWRSAFYIFGGLGMLWCIVWMLLISDSPQQDTGVSSLEREYIISSLQQPQQPLDLPSPDLNDLHLMQLDIIKHRQQQQQLRLDNPLQPDHQQQLQQLQQLRDIAEPSGVPWAQALTSLPMFSLALCHFCHEWAVYTVVKVIPVYLRDVLHLDVKQNSVAALLPGISFCCTMLISAGAADRLRAYGVIGATKIRKIFQCFVLIAALSFCGLQYSGALVNHLDVLPSHSGVLAGLLGTLDASVYFAVPALIRLLVDCTPQESIYSQWRIVLIVTAASQVFSALIFFIVGSAHPLFHPGSTSSGQNQDHMAYNTDFRGDDSAELSRRHSHNERLYPGDITVEQSPYCRSEGKSKSKSRSPATTIAPKPNRQVVESSNDETDQGRTPQMPHSQHPSGPNSGRGISRLRRRSEEDKNLGGNVLPRHPGLDTTPRTVSLSSDSSESIESCVSASSQPIIDEPGDFQLANNNLTMLTEPKKTSAVDLFVGRDLSESNV